jgi:hypothetical protein
MFRSRVLPLLVVTFAVTQISNPAGVLAASRMEPARSSTLGSDYTSALATADRFLQAWQAGDAENGMVLLTGHAKAKISPDDLEAFFSAASPAAYEIARGKVIRRGRYQFPVLLLGGQSSPSASKGLPRRRVSSIVVLHTGNDDWAVDKLP